MPELPEVEIVTRSLNKLVRNRRIRASELRRERLAPDTPPAEFSRRIDGSAINFVHRRGKHLLFDLDNGQTLITHLRMSGRFMLLPEEAEYPKFTHAAFHFTDGSRLIFQDQRHFGLMKVTATAEMYEAKELNKLAPEPFSDEFSDDYLLRALKSSKRSLKEFLLDQTKVCGLGNIYASEAMFLAGISPRKTANSVSRKRAAELRVQIVEVLREAVELGATLVPDEVNIGEGVYGNGSGTSWRVYDRESQPCPNCESPIIRLKQAGRSTYFCRKCQK